MNGYNRKFRYLQNILYVVPFLPIDDKYKTSQKILFPPIVMKVEFST